MKIAEDRLTSSGSGCDIDPGIPPSERPPALSMVSGIMATSRLLDEESLEEQKSMMVGTCTEFACLAVQSGSASILASSPLTVCISSPAAVALGCSLAISQTAVKETVGSPSCHSKHYSFFQ